MIDNSKIDSLDRMLAQPALIADRGFSEQLGRNLSKTFSLRSKFFALAGVSWLALVLVVSSPRQLIEHLFSLLAMINISDQLQVLNNSLVTSISAVGYSAEPISYLGLLALVLLLFAVFSLVIKD
ncbi:MAG: hypothetical protein COA96_18210 [SAR86 cluster bacterium]|uniref:Uncharacterized protein n=1 Tax=SAR86 cluster bacterium TaxID=2030880 RepID=A0A2A5AD72_9GAMM|nr:MAG: hypothetical protein COA96_18210 [SAR86 cluster bacterium]